MCQAATLTRKVKQTVANSSTAHCHSERFIDGIETTSDRLTGRAGLVVFSRYLRGIGIFPHLNRLFGSLRKSRKGLPVVEIFHQLFCFFLDGTSRHLSYFDALKQDLGYAGAIETAREAMLSSHAVKRFFGAFGMWRIWLFRGVLGQLFLWRLRLVKPAVIELGVDTMVMDNDEAPHREGAAPTYKRVKGFQPLQVTWGRFIIDAVFRGGDKHSNHKDTVAKTLSHLVAKIRRHYRPDVPIIVRMDAGFFDQKLMELLEEELPVGYIVAGKLYEDLQEYIADLDPSAWEIYESQNREWSYVEFWDRRGSWKKHRRAIFSRPVYEDRQRLLEFARPDQILYTNLGCGQKIDDQLKEAGLIEWFEPERILESYHERGSDELVHRALKDFASETLPFKRFSANAAFYYTMLVAFFLYECFKEDVCEGVLPVFCYATTLRRRLFDVAGKIVRHAGRIILKVTETLWKQLQIARLWERSADPPLFAWV